MSVTMLEIQAIILLTQIHTDQNLQLYSENNLPFCGKSVKNG